MQLEDTLRLFPGGVLDATLAGALVGFAVARLMRRGNLHWSWAAVALGVILMARPALGAAAPALLAGAFVAGLSGRRWHRRDIAAGADFSAAASARLTSRALVGRILWLVRRALLGPPPAWRRGELLLGHDTSWREVSIPLTAASGGSHALVVGATGSGKTVTQCRIAVGAIEGGMGAVVIDPKGDRLLREALAAAARRAGRPMLLWTPAGPTVYNPFARGSETEIADKALAGERFTEPHYLRQAQRYLGHAVRTLRDAGEEISLQKLAEQLEPQRLELLAREAGPERAEQTQAYLDSLSPRQRSDLAGARDRLAVLAESDAGRWMDPRTADTERIELLECVLAGAVVLFCLEADRRPLLSQMLAAAIVQDLQTVVAAAQERPLRTLVLIDEFSAVAAEHVVRLFARARSAGISLVLGTQELADLRPVGGERLLEQVMGNLSVLIAHRQGVPASAELIANIAGSRGAWRVTLHSGAGARRTRTRVREPRLEPERIMALETGWAALLAPAHGAQVRITRVLPHEEPAPPLARTPAAGS